MPMFNSYVSHYQYDINSHYSSVQSIQALIAGGAAPEMEVAQKLDAWARTAQADATTDSFRRLPGLEVEDEDAMTVCTTKCLLN